MSSQEKSTPAGAVGIFRLNLFKYSETFIVSQAESYVRNRPIYIGFSKRGAGPANARIATLNGSLTSGVRALLIGDATPFISAVFPERPSLIHAHFGTDAPYAVPLAQRLRIPLVTTLHGWDVTTDDDAMLLKFKPLSIVALARRSALQKRGDLFLCVSNFIRDAALKKGYPPERTIVAPMGIDLEKRTPSTRPSGVLITHVARLVEKKGTVFLIRAFASVISHIPDARLVIVGDGPMKAKLQIEAKNLGVGNNVNFVGALNHVDTLEWIARAAVVAIPSITADNGDSEGLPTVLLEASALAKAVVASRTSGIPEALIDGQTGFLVPERDPASLAHALGLILSDDLVAKKMGEAGRRLMLERYDAKILTAALEDKYESLRNQYERAEFAGIEYKRG